MKPSWLSDIKFNDDGLVLVIVQDQTSNKVLMAAWANEEAIIESVKIGQACYWSRSRNKFWKKGEESGHFQNIKEIYVDCDGDSVLYKVEQVGDIACHTGRNSCFFRKITENQWEDVEPIIKSSKEIYEK